MPERLFHRIIQHEADSILRQTRESLQEVMVQFYQEEIKKFRKKDKRGIILDFGSPHEPAVILSSDGNMRLIKLDFTPEPEGTGELSNLEFCVMAIGFLTNPPKYPKRLLKS